MSIVSLKSFAKLLSIPKQVVVVASARNVSTHKDDIKRSVFISQSNDIFTNLALEDWIYKNMDFTHHQILMLWQNQPCVVIGRHQNPWLEVNMRRLKEAGVKLARRYSGGGTVYHDEGNLNLTFFTNKTKYNRKYNLEIITRALFREWCYKAEVTKNDNIIVRDNLKISGTAAKLGQKNSYHHCTLLVNVNKKKLNDVLIPNNLGIVTNATKSNRASTVNLAEENPNINIKNLIKAIGWEWLRTSPTSLDVDNEFIYGASQNNLGFKYINPNDDWFPGISKLKDELTAWDWIYGKTPKFQLIRQIPVMYPHENDENQLIDCVVTINNALVDNITVNMPERLFQNYGLKNGTSAQVLTDLRGQKFNEKIAHALNYLLLDKSYDKQLAKMQG